MKKYLKAAVCLGLLATLCGCVSAREEQNPQPRTNVPCTTWTDSVAAASAQKAEVKTAPKVTAKEAEKPTDAKKVPEKKEKKIAPPKMLKNLF